MNTQLDHCDKCELFVCDCSDASHNIIFQLWDWGADGKLPGWDDSYCELSVHVHLGEYPSFWRRVWLGIKYVFGYKSRYGHYDVMSVRYEDVPRLKAILDEFTQKVDRYSEKSETQKVFNELKTTIQGWTPPPPKK